MSELKPLEERIKNLTVGLLGMEDGETIQVSKAFLQTVRKDMVEQLKLRRAQPDNEPHELMTTWETPNSCPNCLEHLSLDWSYCPNCGAKMDKEDIT